MSSNVMLDLTEVGWPENLLTCKSKLDAMTPGSEIDILAKDLDVVQNLVQIVEHSQCSIMSNTMSGGCLQVRIKKM